MGVTVKISPEQKIIQIQKEYFGLLKDCFKNQIAEVQNEDDSENRILKWAITQTNEDIIYFTRRRLEDMANFWKIHYSDLKNAILVADMLPTYSVSRPIYLRRQFSSAGLYIDTFVCHDECFSALRNLEVLSPYKHADLCVKLLSDYLDLIALEFCFTADLKRPFAIILPGSRDFDYTTEIKYLESDSKLFTSYCNELLDKNYLSIDEVFEASKNINGSSAIKHAIKQHSILPAPFREPKTEHDRLSQCFERMRMIKSQSAIIVPESPNLKDLLISFFTEFVVMESQLCESVEFDLAPLFPRYTWDLYKWRIENANKTDGKLLGWEERNLTAIATSIQHENLDWLGNIPLKSMIELRESDFLQDFRTSFRLARKRMTLQEGADFNKMAKDVENAIEKAISDNQADIADLEKQAKVKIINATGSFLTKTGLSIASTWIPPLAIVGMISDTAGYAKEIIETRKLAKDLPDRLKRGPWGLMIDAKQKEQK